MAPMVSSFDVARPPEEVFSYVTDATRFGDWQRDVVSVRMVDERRFTTTRRIGRTERTMTQEITEVAPPRTWAARGVDGPIRPSGRITVEPLDGGTRSRVTIALDFEGHGIGNLLLPLVRRQAKRGAPASYRRLQELLDSTRRE
jgi:uncharacterized protein YndB with AHSA1/START domain